MPEPANSAGPQRPLETGIYTETLARLYLKQGFTHQALRIYRHLAQAEPANQELRTRLQQLEREVTLGGTGEALTAAPATAPVALHSAPVSARPARGQTGQQQVLRQLERWLHSLQRQRLQPTRLVDAGHVGA